MFPESSELPAFASDDARRRRTNKLLDRIQVCRDPQELQALRNGVVVTNIAVADRLAGRFSGRGIPSEDLRQVARAALVRVVRDFRPDRADDFLSYAVPSIRGELRKYFRDAGWTVRPPRQLQEARKAVSDATADLSQEVGRSPRPAEIADRVGLDIQTVREVASIDHCFRPDSLDAPLRDDDARSLGETVGEEGDDLERAEARVLLEPLLKGLAARDRAVIELRYFRGMTQSEVGDRIGVSQMQVSRIQARVLEHLREAAHVG
jgi:RNA polymerase sigma-B factor